MVKPAFVGYLTFVDTRLVASLKRLKQVQIFTDLFTSN